MTALIDEQTRFTQMTIPDRIEPGASGDQFKRIENEFTSFLWLRSSVFLFDLLEAVCLEKRQRDKKLPFH